MILDSSRTKALFLDIVAKAKKRYSFRIENFTVMGNHFHLIIQPGKGESLSRIMQWILSVFAQAYNKVHGLIGHVWGERFFSRVIRTVSEYLIAFDYVDENPVNAGIGFSVDCFSEEEAYERSSIRCLNIYRYLFLDIDSCC